MPPEKGFRVYLWLKKNENRLTFNWVIEKVPHNRGGHLRLHLEFCSYSVEKAVHLEVVAEGMSNIYNNLLQQAD